MIATLKIFAYFILSKRGFNLLLKPFVYILLKIQPVKNGGYHASRVVLTIDCESGYLEHNNQRKWMFQEPEAFEGYYFGINNILDLLRKYNIKATFLLSTQCFASGGETRKLIITTISRLISEGHELGLHIHPKEDSALKKECKMDFKFTSAKYYDQRTIELMISKSKLLVSRYLDSKIADSIVSLRWANFALDLDKIESIGKHCKIDSSICPRCSGHNNDDRKFDWSNYKNYCVHKVNDLVEVPLTTFNFLGWRPADPSLGVLTEIAFDKYGGSHINPFVLITHSSECTYLNGKPTYVLSNLERFILNNRNKNIRYCTLNEF